jgi:anaerobic selenocysteine-containing dehydrogenase
MSPRDHFDPSPRPGDEVRSTTCYMCACRCGIDVHLKDGRVAYIEGNRDHPVNKGVLCAKGSAGILQVNSPARLRAPLLRTGPRGSGQFKEISWDEALALAVSWLKPIRDTAPEKLAFFTGRDQSQSFTSLWAQAFGTPNYAAHGGFCSVNMAAAGIYTLGGAFWEFGAPDWERASCSSSSAWPRTTTRTPIKIGLGRLKARGARVIGINPIRTGYNAVADDWLGVTPGSDGLLVLSLIHCLLAAGKIDLPFLARFTNASCLVNEDPKSPQNGLLLRDEDGRPLVIDRAPRSPPPGTARAWSPTCPPPCGPRRHPPPRPPPHGRALPAPAYAPRDRRPPHRPRPRAHPPAGRRDRRAPPSTASPVVLDRPWTDFRGHAHATMPGRPVAIHAMRGISAHSNGFQTARAIHLLQALLGAVETPGGMRFKPPYPKPATAHPRPHARVTPGHPLDGPHLGYPMGPEDLCVDADGTPLRVDKAFSWEAPLSAHGMMHMVIANAHAGDPYRIDTLFLYMANMAWNSSMNTTGTMAMLTDTDESGAYVIPHVIYSDAYSSETVAYADLVLPDTTYLERHDCISLLDRPISEPEAAGDAIRWPVIEPDRDVRGFQSVLVDLGARLQLPGFVNPDGSAKYRDYADYIVNHQRRPGVGPLAGWRTGPGGLSHGRGEPNEAQLDEYIRAGGFWQGHVPEGAAFYKPWNRAYQDWAVAMGFYDAPQPYLLQLWSEPLRRFQLAAEGEGPRQPPDHLRARLHQAMDPLPVWWAPFGDEAAEGYPLHALTQRPMAMYHAWHGQNPWLRQIHGRNPLYVPKEVWEQQGFSDGDWARVSSPTERSPSPSPAWTRSTPAPSGPGTPSASARAPGPSARTPPRAARPSSSTTSSPSSSLPAATATAGRTPTPSPARPPGSTSASASRSARPRAGPARPPAARLARPDGTGRDRLEGAAMTIVCVPIRVAPAGRCAAGAACGIKGPRGACEHAPYDDSSGPETTP